MTDLDNKIELIRQELERVTPLMNDVEMSSRGYFIGKASGLCDVLEILTGEHKRIDFDGAQWSVVEVSR